MRFTPPGLPDPTKTACQPPAITPPQESGGDDDLRNAGLSLYSGPAAGAVEALGSITLKIWEKHGIRQAGFFTTLVGESHQELTYLLAWESLADREKKWTAFQSDPEWIEARAKTEADGQIVANIVNQMLAPTAFSAVK